MSVGLSSSAEFARGQRVLARLRHRQLELARRGLYCQSAVYAQRAQRVAGAMGWMPRGAALPRIVVARSASAEVLVTMGS